MEKSKPFLKIKSSFLKNVISELLDLGLGLSGIWNALPDGLGTNPATCQFVLGHIIDFLPNPNHQTLVQNPEK